MNIRIFQRLKYLTFIYLRFICISLLYLFKNKRFDNRIHHIYCHSVPKTKKKRFEYILKSFQKIGTFINLNQAYDLVTSNQNIDNVYFTISFDDGFNDNYDVAADILDKLNIKGCFFISTAFISSSEKEYSEFCAMKLGRPPLAPMNWENVKDLHRRGHIIGSHTVNHKCLSKCDLNELIFESTHSKSLIEEITNEPCDFISWPYGTLNHINHIGLRQLNNDYKAVFSGIRGEFKLGHNNYYCREHFEVDWPLHHIKYFLTNY